MDREAARKREAEFLADGGDVAAVYRCDAEGAADNQISLEQVRLAGKSPIAANFDLLALSPIIRPVDDDTILEQFRFTRLIAPGDIVAIKRSDMMSCWYVDLLAYRSCPVCWKII